MLMENFLMAKDLFGNRGKSRLETTVWAIQLLLLLVGIISIVLVFKTAVLPYSFSKVSTLPQLWLSLKFWLSPPYIYVIINIIIVFLVVTSTLYHPNINEDQHCPEYVNEDQHSHKYVSPRLQDEDYGGTFRQTVPPEPLSTEEINKNEDVDFIFSHETPTTLPLHSVDTTKIVPSEKKTNEEAEHIPSSPEHMKNILVTEQPVTDNLEEDSDSMEATWEAIIEAGKLPEKQQLKKMETWNAPPVVMAAAEEDGNMKKMRKLETFNESVLGRQRGGLMRDVSVGQVELNNRIEAFISKFNKDMRLQRQESDQRFLEMINR